MYSLVKNGYIWIYIAAALLFLISAFVTPSVEGGPSGKRLGKILQTFCIFLPNGLFCNLLLNVKCFTEKVLPDCRNHHVCDDVLEPIALIDAVMTCNILPPR